MHGTTSIYDNHKNGVMNMMQKDILEGGGIHPLDDGNPNIFPLQVRGGNLCLTRFVPGQEIDGVPARSETTPGEEMCWSFLYKKPHCEGGWLDCLHSAVEEVYQRNIFVRQVSLVGFCVADRRSMGLSCRQQVLNEALMPSSS